MNKSSKWLSAALLCAVSASGPGQAWSQQPAPFAAPSPAADSSLSPLPPAGQLAAWNETQALPTLTASTNAHILELEARLAELETRLAAQGLAPKKDDKGYVVGSDMSMSGKWTPNGGELQSKNGDFKVKLSGRVQADGVFLQDPDHSQITSIPGGAGTKDSFYFRRLRLGAYGTMWETIDWATEFDIANTEFNVDPVAGGNNPPTGLRSSAAFPAGGNVMSIVAPTDVWMTWREVPVVGNIRAGNHKEMIGLEHMTSSRFLDFMERSPLQDAFNGPNNNGFSPGVSVYDTMWDQNATWGLGFFKNNDYESGFPFDVGNNNYVYNGRFTWTPYFDELSEGRYMLHLGVGAAIRTFDNEPASYTGGTNVRIRARGDLRNVASTLPPNYVDTGNFYAENQELIDPEIAFVWGPWLIQAEYEWCRMGQARAIKTGPSLGLVQFHGGYVECMYFLTGEHRAYNRQQGAFGRVVPINNAYFVRNMGFCGMGAWQAGVRYDWLDLNSGGVQGGNLQNITVGLNWFLNPNTKIQFNYVVGFVDNTAPVAGPNNSLNGSRFVGDGVITSFGTRLAWDF